MVLILIFLTVGVEHDTILLSDISNSVLIQWGTAYPPSVSADTSVIFPTSYTSHYTPTACLSYWGQGHCIGCVNLTISGMTLTGWYSVDVKYWITVGY